MNHALTTAARLKRLEDETRALLVAMAAMKLAIDALQVAVEALQKAVKDAHASG